VETLQLHRPSQLFPSQIPLQESQSELLYDWWFTANQSILAPSPLRPMNSNFFQLNPCSHNPYAASSLKRWWVSFTVAAGSHQCSHYWVRVLWDSWPYFTLLNSRLTQPGGPCACIYISQAQGGPIMPPGTTFPFGRLLRLTGIWWWYSNLPPCGDSFTTDFVPCL
jgi:hypothetical protein